MQSENSYILKIDGNVQEFKYTYDRNSVNEGWNNISPSQFLSPDEIANNEISLMKPEDRELFKAMKKEELIRLHFGYGMHVRNTYGLWHPNNPFVIKDDLNEGHPDGLSMRAIYTMHALLQHSPYDNAMSVIQE